VVALNKKQGPVFPPYYQQIKNPSQDANVTVLVNDDGDGGDNCQNGEDNADDEANTGPEDGNKDDASEAPLSQGDISLDILP